MAWLCRLSESYLLEENDSRRSRGLKAFHAGKINIVCLSIQTVSYRGNVDSLAAAQVEWAGRPEAQGCFSVGKHQDRPRSQEQSGFVGNEVIIFLSS